MITAHCRSVARRLITTLVLVPASAALAATGWPHWGMDAGGQRHSPARQITPQNVGRLTEAWRYRTGELGQDTRDERLTFEATPVLWNDTLYVSTAYGAVHAIDAVSGKRRWVFDPQVPRSIDFGEIASRGVSLWHAPAGTDGPCAHRVLWGSIAGEAYAVDALTGIACAGFGDNGRVNLRSAVRGEIGRYTITSPPAIVGRLAVFGSAIGDNNGIDVERGIVRAIDAVSGTEVWRFDPIPRSAADPAYSSWAASAARRFGGANAWAPLSVDADLGLVFVPTSSPSPDFYGGARPGDNRYANSLVALRVADGSVVWHQQLIHHDVWDYDLPAQPVLTEIRDDQASYPVVLQVTKTGHVFSFHRATGEPYWPIEEVPVPQRGAPGEALSATQPRPQRPPPLVGQRALTPEDAWGLLYFDQRACARLIDSARSEGMFTPPSEQGTLMYPGWAGGFNWGGLSVDAARQIAVGFTMELPGIVRLIPRTNGPLDEVADAGPDGEYAPMRGTPWYMYRAPLLSPLGIPCIAPPWGRLHGIDIATGSVLWSVPVGTPADIAPVWVPAFEWGMPGIGGPMTTATGLVFMGAAADHVIRAFDIHSGERLWQADLPFGGQANPMSYEIGDRQYVVIAAGGHSGPGLATGDVLVAFALP